MTSMLFGGLVLLFFLAMVAGLRVGVLGLKAGRIFARMKELEQVSDAMGAEISRLSGKPSQP